MRLLYDLLRSMNLDLNHFAAIIQNMNTHDAIDAIEKINNSILASNRDLEFPNSLFNFVANDSLSGGLSGCEDPSCRVDQAIELSEFAALYADRVLVRNPMDKYFEDYKIHDFDNRTRYIFLGDIAVLWLLEPLLESNILQFIKLDHHFCAKCFRKYSSSDAFNYEHRLELAEKFVKGVVEKGITVEAVSENGRVYVEMRGPEDLLEHGVLMIDFAYHIPQELKHYATQPGRYRLSSEVIERIGLFERLYSSNVDDFAVQDWYTKNFDYSYLTNHTLDTRIIEVINSRPFNDRNRYLVPGIRHAVPALGKMPIKELLKLRRRNQDTFDNYRNSIRTLLADSSIKCERDIRDAFLAVVKPRLDEIDHDVKVYRKSVGKDLALDLVIYSGILAIGLHSGLLPSNIAELVAGIGGVEIAHSLVKSAVNIPGKSADERKNPYYFLWKANRKARRFRN